MADLQQPKPLDSNPQDPAALNVTVAINYITPELEQFVSSQTIGPSGALLAGSGVTAFVPARLTDNVRTTAQDTAGPNTQGGNDTTVPTTPGAVEQIARCVSDDGIAGSGQQPTDASKSTSQSQNFSLQQEARTTAQDTPDGSKSSRARRTRRKITPKKIALEKQMVRYSLALVPEARRNSVFLHRWRVGEQDLHARLKKRDEFAEKQAASTSTAVAASSISGTTPQPMPQRDEFGRFIPSSKKSTTPQPPKPPLPPITTSSGRTVRRRLSATDDGGGGSGSGIGSVTSTQPPQNGLNDHPRLISSEAAPHIGPGWMVRVVGRPGYDDPSRKSKARYDRYYFSPDGKRFKNMAEVNKYKHDMAKSMGMDVTPNLPKPSRASSRLKKQEEQEEPTDSTAAGTDSSTGADTAPAPDTARSTDTTAAKSSANTHVVATPSTKDDASCATCKHFPFCPHATPTARTPGGKKALKEQNPFIGNESVIWVPSTRSEWNDCVDEMTAVCYSAALRKYQQQQQQLELEERSKGNAARQQGGSSKPGGKDGKGKPLKPPHKPLSRDYIRDRIDIDDPIRGYQIRHKTGGWLQGFVLTTTFTTWTHYFKWDSTHPKSGIYGSAVAKAAASAGMVGMDHDGSLSAMLEDQPRSGDPNHSGVVWPTIAEISLVGALGCGEYLIRMALDDICRRDCYDYVVLQATDTSRTFYERFGFVRVGAVSKYGKQARQTAAAAGTGSNTGAALVGEQDLQGAQLSNAGGAASQSSAPLVGYRHWTYADETSQSINKWHGGPSYMMALKIDRSRMNPNAAGHHCVECGRAVGKVSFLDALADCFVHEKPKVTNLGGTLGRRKPAQSWGAPPIALPLSSKPAMAAAGKKRSQEQQSGSSKRARVDGRGRSRPVTPVGGLTEFERRQLNDPWLAVAPLTKKAEGKRKPPRSRGERQSSRKPGGRGSSATALSFDVESKSKQQKQPKPSNRSPLRKQRIPPMYRDPKKVYYYNKVIKPKKKTKSSAPYYFVLHYDEDARTVRIIPLEERGTFIGRREGRIKWKADVLPRPEPKPGSTPEEEDKRYYDSMGVFTAPCDDYIVVQSDSVHKCAGVKEDSWDVYD